MEGRRIVKLILPIAISVLVLISPSYALAYTTDTHAFLTDEIVKFYDRNFSNKGIPDDLKIYLIDGSRREDDFPRWMNHFYDPVNDSGLTRNPAIDPLYFLGTWESSKNWAQDENNQNADIYKTPTVIASILTAIQQRKLSAISDETNFTWQEAIRYYLNGEKEKAMFTLGHVLHLIEDASVPDHTRNDPHASGSPYEEWTSKFTLTSPDKNTASVLQTRQPILLPDLNSYFTSLATYSNNNFYSKDTIGAQSGYNSPQPDYISKSGDYFYGFKEDKEYGDYKLFVKEKLGLFDTVISNTSNTSLILAKDGGDKVMYDYWPRLSTKSVQYGAGVVNLFFQDVEKAKNDPNFQKELSKSLLSQVVSAVSNFSGAVVSTAREAIANMFGGNSSEKIVETIDVNNSAGNVSVVTPPSSDAPSVEVPEKPTQAPTTTIKTQTNTATTNTIKPKETKVIADKEQEKVAKLPEESKKTEPPVPVAASKTCNFATSQSPSHSGMIINEVAWMGGPESAGLTANDEWIELKNVSGSEVNLSGWQLIDQGEQIKINLALINESKVGAGQFILLERTDDGSVPNVTADLIYSGALSNTNEGLRLFDSQCNLIDEVLASPDWPAGVADSRRTMEREPNFVWHTYGGSGTNGIFGTPKQENGSALVIYTGGGGGGGTNTTTNITPNNTTPQNNEKAACSQASLNTASRTVLINEVAWAGTSSSSSSDEWIELYNPGSATAQLSNWELLDKAADIKIVFGVSDVIAPGGYYFLERTDNSTVLSVTADKIFTGAIGNSAESLRLFDGNCGLADEIIAESNWPAGTASPDYKTAERSSDLTWHSYSGAGTNNIMGTPRAANSNVVSENNQQDTQQTIIPLKITEVVYDIKGTDGTEEPDEGKELVKISNPNDTEVDLSAYSLQYLGSSGDFSDIKKKKFEAGNRIPGQGIFKIGANCHPGAKPPTPCENVDLSWSQELNNTSGTVFLVSNQELLTGLSDPDIVDGFHYPTVAQIAEPGSFEASYDPNKLEINLSWAGNDSLVYQIQEYNSPGVTVFEGKGTSFVKRIDEVGRSYKFSIRAFNENAEHTELIEKEITVPSFIKDVHLYNAEHHYFGGKQTDNLLEFSYDKYPFLPRDINLALAYGEPPGPNYKVVVFYLNKEAPKRLYLDNAMPLAEDRANVLRLGYKTCSSGWADPTALSLILPDGAEQCNINIGGFANGSLDYPTYLAEGDLHLLFPVAAPGSVTFDTGNSSNYTAAPLVAGDYVTASFYGFWRDFPQGTNPADLEGGIWSNFTLLAVDKTPYNFSSDIPAHLKPNPPQNLQFLLNQEKSILKTSWGKSSDPNTLDNLLRYEVNYDDLSWEPVSALSYEKIVEPGVVYNIKVRAVDGFGIVSDEVSGSFPVPSSIQPPFGISDIKWGRIDSSLETKVSFSYPTYPFMPNSNQFDMMVFYLNRLPPLNYEYSAIDTIYPTTTAANSHYPRLIISHKSCAYDNDLKDFSTLILAKSVDAVTMTDNSGKLFPNFCFTWISEPQKSVLVPVPPTGQAGIINLPVTGLARSDKTLNDLSAADFITIGFYNIDQWNNVLSVGNGTHKYYFRP